MVEVLCAMGVFNQRVEAGILLIDRASLKTGGCTWVRKVGGIFRYEIVPDANMATKIELKKKQ